MKQNHFLVLLNNEAESFLSVIVFWSRIIS